MALTTHDLAARTDDGELKRLLSYLSSDPDNAALRADCAERALDCGNPALARDLLGSDRKALGDRALGLLGLAQIASRDFAEAVKSFEALTGRGVDDPAVRFNLAWSLNQEGEPSKALGQLAPEVTGSLAQAAMLEVRLLHEQGRFDEAAKAARDALERFPDDPGLAAAVSVLALDIEDLELARRCAEKAGDQPDALATLGTLALGKQEVAEAVRLFDRALALNEDAPRAWIGRGLARLLESDSGAAPDIDRGAELFGDHIGSWIAAGWAHLIAGERGEARKRFERALAIDGNFGESHGSLAVVDILDGNQEAAGKRVEVALRLDPKSFSGRFAKSLLAERTGDPQAAREQVAGILGTPVNQRGDTAAAALARLSLG